MSGLTKIICDVTLHDAAQMYRENWDGCKDLWKLEYRQRHNLAGKLGDS
jgi:hypothetical protein